MNFSHVYKFVSRMKTSNQDLSLSIAFSRNLLDPDTPFGRNYFFQRILAVLIALNSCWSDHKTFKRKLVFVLFILADK